MRLQLIKLKYFHGKLLKSSENLIKLRLKNETVLQPFKLNYNRSMEAT